MSTSPSREAKRSSYRAPYKVGDVIDGKYELVRKAGRGSMGEVWVATHRTLHSKVAIKIINPEVLLPVIAERLLREARAAAMLNHPSIVRVFDLGETPASGPFIVMELLEGESLRQRLDREGTISPEEALALLLPIASAMHAAHAQGIIHRDLKPDNIMLVPTDSGALRPKLVDFGIAKLAWTEPDGTGAMMIGTPDYMSPEQARGAEALDHRTDMWSFCVLLYELLSGEMPFAGDTTWEVLRSIVDEPAPSLAERGITDPALWAILERGLDKDPAARWGSMRELGDALARWLVTRGIREDACGASLRVEWLENWTVDQVKDRTPPRGERRQSQRPLGDLARSAIEPTAGEGDDPGAAGRRRGTVVLLPGSRGRRLAFAGVLMAAAASLGFVTVSHLDPSASMLSSLARRAEPLPAVARAPSSPPSTPAAAPAAPPPAIAMTTPAMTQADPEPTPRAQAPYRVGGGGARALATTSSGLGRVPALPHPARKDHAAGDSFVEDPPQYAPAAPSAAPRAEPIAVPTAARTTPAPTASPAVAAPPDPGAVEPTSL